MVEQTYIKYIIVEIPTLLKPWRLKCDMVRGNFRVSLQGMTNLNAFLASHKYLTKFKT